ncbi:hypothetical protein FTUN_5968 [Frigoriglobus tundricola]|uniref:Uncharacterized protein n=1 Tax=Frigoriglobus tundricola TaxID=2774151 RepID=A0A6M5YWR5_9BACT|nr:hypothetical protein FTUN_5968 [Frigoriglobus tundricola]
MTGQPSPASAYSISSPARAAVGRPNRGTCRSAVANAALAAAALILQC